MKLADLVITYIHDVHGDPMPNTILIATQNSEEREQIIEQIFSNERVVERLKSKINEIRKKYKDVTLENVTDLAKIDMSDLIIRGAFESILTGIEKK